MRSKPVAVALCLSIGLAFAVPPVTATQEDGPDLDYDDPCAYADPYLWSDVCGEAQSDGSVVHSGCNACVACAGYSTCCISSNAIASNGTLACRDNVPCVRDTWGTRCCRAEGTPCRYHA